jgi:hypothetical protein
VRPARGARGGRRARVVAAGLSGGGPPPRREIEDSVAALLAPRWCHGHRTLQVAADPDPDAMGPLDPAGLPRRGGAGAQGAVCGAGLGGQQLGAARAVAGRAGRGIALVRGEPGGVSDLADEAGGAASTAAAALSAQSEDGDLGAACGHGVDGGGDGEALPGDADDAAQLDATSRRDEGVGAARDAGAGQQVPGLRRGARQAAQPRGAAARQEADRRGARAGGAAPRAKHRRAAASAKEARAEAPAAGRRGRWVPSWGWGRDGEARDVEATASCLEPGLHLAADDAGMVGAI